MAKGFISINQQKAAFARMGKDYHAMNPDITHRAANTLPDTPENRKIWAENSGRIDIEGMDTPTKKTSAEKTRFVDRFEKIKGIEKAIYIPSKLHLTIFYNRGMRLQNVKQQVLNELNKSNLTRSVETISYYEE